MHFLGPQELSLMNFLSSRKPFDTMFCEKAKGFRVLVQGIGKA